MSAIQAQAKPPLPHIEFVSIGFSPADREVLYARIEARFHAMMAQGFVQEVQRLYERGDLHADLPSIRAVGYRQLWQHVAGQCSLEQAVAQGILATRHLARRQLIWMRAESGLQWIDASAASALRECEQKIIRCFT